MAWVVLERPQFWFETCLKTSMLIKLCSNIFVSQSKLSSLYAIWLPGSMRYIVYVSDFSGEASSCCISDITAVSDE